MSGVVLEDGRLRVTGDLGFHNAARLWRESQPLFAAGGGPLEVDLSRVGRADSAGLALLVEWMREARRQGREIRFLGMPPQMLAIAGVSGLADLLPIA